MPSRKNSPSREVVFELTGYLNRGVLSELSSRLVKADSSAPPILTLNCANLYYMDSSVIGLLVETHQRLAGEGRTLNLRWVPDSIVKVIQSAKLDKILHLEPDRRKDRLHSPFDSPPEPVLGSLKRCWELYDCGAESCRNYSKHVYDFWLTPNVPCKSVISEDLQREISSCVRCEVFKTNINQFGQIHEHIETYVRQAEQAYHRVLGDREGIEDSLRRMRAYAESLFEKATDAILVFDEKSGEIWSANAPARQLLEIDEREPTGKSLFAYCPSLETGPRPWVEPPLTEDSHHRRWDQEWITPSGSRRMMEVTYSPVSLPRRGSILAVARDVSRQRKTDSTREGVLADLMESQRAVSGYISWSLQFSEAESIHSLAPRILNAWLEALPMADACLLLVHDRKTHQLVVRGSKGYAHPGRLSMLRLLPGESLPGIDGRMLWGESGHLQFRGVTPVIDALWRDSLGDRAGKSQSLVELRHAETLVGFALLHSFRKEDAFPEAESPLTRALAEMSALALGRVSTLEELRHHETGLLEQWNSLPGAAMVLEESGAISSWNRVAETWFGWSESDARGKPLGFLFGDMGPILWAGILHGIQENSAWRGDGVGITRVGNRVPLRMEARRIGSLVRLSGRILVWMTRDATVE
ncbi:MAG: PAS domain-containing protein [Candidatus Omnitrophica bacterium]|nr:PAS domain-containing protein [Candidatus Omnitrophota bacterium]